MAAVRMTLEDAPDGSNGGGYVTRGRAHDLERRIAALEAVNEERFRRLEAELARVRTLHVDSLRAQAQALLELLRDEMGAAAPRPVRRTGGR